MTYRPKGLDRLRRRGFGKPLYAVWRLTPQWIRRWILWGFPWNEHGAVMLLPKLIWTVLTFAVCAILWIVCGPWWLWVRLVYGPYSPDRSLEYYGGKR